MTRINSALLCVWLAVSVVRAGSPTAIKSGHFIDVLGGKVLNNVVVVIEGNTIKAVGAEVAIPTNSTVLDLGNSWVRKRWNVTESRI